MPTSMSNTCTQKAERLATGIERSPHERHARNITPKVLHNKVELVRQQHFTSGGQSSPSLARSRAEGMRANLDFQESVTVT